MILLLIFCAALLLVYVLVLAIFSDPATGLIFSREDLAADPLHVPPGFLWGSATSAHQVEGGCSNNNWARFESAVDAAGHPRILNGERAGAGADHWNRHSDDIRLMKDLSLNAYRFSVEWSRIEPSEGTFDSAALAHYAGVARDLRASGIEPMVTLHHFTNPLWFEDRGAFLRDDSPEIFARCVRAVGGALGESVRLWVTINEPTVYALNGYWFGEFPPAERDAKNAVRVMRNLLRAHTAAYRAVKELHPGSAVGPALNFFVFDPTSRLNPADVLTAHLITRNANEALVRYLCDGVFRFGIVGIARDYYDSGMRDSFDFIGLNYYTRVRTHLSLSGNSLVVNRSTAPPERCTDMGWEIYPEGLYRTLQGIHGFTPKPIYITENGIADESDTKRAAFIESHLRVMNKAIAEGIDVRGYFYWSLLDNFEWSLGYTKRFGLYRVDFRTQERTLREGSKMYPAMIAQFTSS